MPLEVPMDSSSQKDKKGKCITAEPSPSGSGGSNNRSAWLQVTGAFFVFFNTWGVILAFGAFETYYHQNLFKGYSESSISWIGTISAFLLLLGGGPAGAMYDRGQARPLLFAGSGLIALGLMMASLASEYYQVFLAQGVTVGLGAALLWIPCMSIVAVAFKDPSLRALAVGIASAGSSIGGIIYPIMFRLLQPRIGFGWAVRTMAFLSLGTSAVSLAALAPLKQVRKSTSRRLVDLSALKEPHFVAWMFVGFFDLVAYYAPLVYLPLFVETQIENLPHSDFAFYTLAIANGASAASRVGASGLASLFGAPRMFFVALAGSSILLFGMSGIGTTAGLIIWAVLWGLFTGLIMSLPGAIVVDLCPTPDVIGTRMGMTFYGAAVGVLVGSPISGIFIRGIEADTHSSWVHLQVLNGTIMAIAAVLLIPAWLFISYKSREVGDTHC